MSHGSHIFFAALLAFLALPVAAAAQDEGQPLTDAELGPDEDDDTLVLDEEDDEDIVLDEDDDLEIDGFIDVTATRLFNPGRATSRITREELVLRLPRSAPDALRYEPGVYVQQTAHSQGSAFIRGRTGQQTVLLFDGVRMNNSLFRQGPNQYFFTIDSRTIESIDVLRGSASTRYGTDAIAGVINASPIEPLMDPNAEGFVIKPLGAVRFASADADIGGRLQLDMQFTPRIGVVAGIGYRRVGQLESGGPVLNPRNGLPPEVPRFAPDGRTQLGTGFNELTNDVRAVWQFARRSRLVLAWYDYRQSDAPRTDNCAPPEAPFNECLQYDEQNRSVAFARVEGDWGSLASAARLTLSWQRQHERRTHERPSSFVINGGRDDVDTFGGALQAQTDTWRPTDNFGLHLRYGGDVYHDRVESVAWLIFTDLDITRLRTRGQYIDGSTYTWGGAFAEAEAIFWERLLFRAGGRVSTIAASAPEDPESGTLAVDGSWNALVGNAAVEWWATDWMTIIAGLDQGFRAPNLDDLTSRQQTGPGFQFENAGLEPEKALTAEMGLQLFNEHLEFDGWVFYSTLDDAIARSPRNSSQCPPNTSACNNSRSQFQLVNLPDTAVIYGAEASLKLMLPLNLSARGTISYAFGEGPNPGERPEDPSLPFTERVPLSRIPPLNGTAEVLWRHPRGYYLGGGLRWATKQDRLALSDQSDARIPLGGTPGFSVFDVRAGWRFDERGLISAVFENVTDAAYRYHGSSVNGPGRGLMVNMEYGF